MLALLSPLLLPLLAPASPVVQRDTSQYIQSYRNGLCLTVSGTPADGSAVTTGACASASLWDISRGNGLVVLHGTNFCLDAGTDPHNNVPSKIWQCYPGLTQQQWYYTDDNRIAITGGTQCLDEDADGPQTYQCTTGNTNQVWYAYGGSGPTTTSTASTTSTSASSSSSASSTVVTTTASTTSSSASSTPTTPVTQGLTLHPNGDTTKCLTVASASAYNGQTVEVATCFDPSSPYYAYQKWILSRGSGSVQLAGTNFCLDAGVGPHNGVGAKIWQCYPGLEQQTWYYTDDNRIAITGGDQCLDVTLGSGPVGGSPYGSLEEVQTWACTGGDVQQIWTS